MDLPRISIITPVFNGESTIKVCIDSVAAQTYQNFEHVIMDGQSTDNTLQILDRYAKKHDHLRFFSQSDRGIYDAMNMGLEKITGEWVFFLGADDCFFDDEVLENIFGGESQEKFDVLYGPIFHKRTQRRFFHKFDKHRLTWMNMSHQGLFTHRRVFEKIGNFSLKYKALADYEFNMRWFGDPSFQLKYIDQPVSIYDETGFSVTYFDKTFYRDKLNLISKHLKIDHDHTDFPSVAIAISRVQVKNGDFINALKNALKASRASGKIYYVRIALHEIFTSFFSRVPEREKGALKYGKSGVQNDQY